MQIPNVKWVLINNRDGFGVQTTKSIVHQNARDNMTKLNTGEKMEKIKKYKNIVKTYLFFLYIITFLLISLFHQMDYERGVYDCKHMSRDLEDLLETFFVETTIIVCTYNDTNKTGHCFIEIFGIGIDSVSLLPRNRERYDQVYRFDDFSDCYPLLA